MNGGAGAEPRAAILPQQMVTLFDILLRSCERSTPSAGASPRDHPRRQATHRPPTRSGAVIGACSRSPTSLPSRRELPGISEWCSPTTQPDVHDAGFLLDTWPRRSASCAATCLTGSVPARHLRCGAPPGRWWFWGVALAVGASAGGPGHSGAVHAPGLARCLDSRRRHATNPGTQRPICPY